MVLGSFPLLLAAACASALLTCCGSVAKPLADNSPGGGSPTIRVTNLAVADSQNYRVLLFNGPLTSARAPAWYWRSQASMTATGYPNLPPTHCSLLD